MSDAIIRSRVKINPDELEKIKKHLGVRNIKNEIDSLISGGFLAQIGDKIFDFTITRPSGFRYASVARASTEMLPM